MREASQPQDTWGPTLAEHRTGRYHTGITTHPYYADYSVCDKTSLHHALPEPPSPPRELRAPVPTPEGGYRNPGYECGNDGGGGEVGEVVRARGLCPRCITVPAVYDGVSHPLYAIHRYPPHRFNNDATQL